MGRIGVSVGGAGLVGGGKVPMSSRSVVLSGSVPGKRVRVLYLILGSKYLKFSSQVEHLAR